MGRQTQEAQDNAAGLETPSSWHGGVRVFGVV